MNIFILILLCIAVFVLGFVAGKNIMIEEPVGELIIDHESIPEDDPYLFLNTRVNPRTLIGRKTITLEVITEKLVSQK